MFIKSFGLKDSPRLTEAKSINLIIGDNGTGKSTLVERIYALAKGNYKNIEMPIRTLNYNEVPSNKVSVEFEQLPEDAIFMSGTYETSRTHAGYFSEDMALDIYQMKSSSGQAVLLGMIPKLKSSKENSVVVLDEPEKGLDFSNQIRIADMIMGLSKTKNCQFFVVTHSLLVLRIFQGIKDRVSLTVCNELKSNPIDFGYVDTLLQITAELND